MRACRWATRSATPTATPSGCCGRTTPSWWTSTGKVALNSKETIAALKYATELQKTMMPGTLTWNDVGNNKAYTAEQIGMTFNGVSLYSRC